MPLPPAQARYLPPKSPTPPPNKCRLVTPRDRCARCPPVIRCCCLVMCLRVMHCIPCHHVHFIRIHVRLMHPSIFPVVHFAFRRSYVTDVPFYLFLCAGVKRFRIGTRPVMRSWFTTSRPPVKFRAIWTSFDTPMVNRGTEKASCVLQPNTLPKWPKIHLNPLHHLGLSITIAWPQSAPHLDSPSSLYL